MLKAGFKVLTDVNKIMKAEVARTQKAASLALSKEAYRLKTEGSFLLKTGKLSLSPLSVLESGRKKKARAPLRGLFRGLTYKVNRFALTAKVGFLAPSAGTEWQAKIADKSAAGYRWIFPPRYRDYLHTQGIHLRKGTTAAQVPARDIMDALIAHEGGEHRIMQNISSNFNRKMQGERI